MRRAASRAAFCIRIVHPALAPRRSCPQDPMPDAAEIDRLRAEFQAALAAAATDQALREVRDRYLARKGGVVAALMKAVAGAPPADRPLLGKLANELKNEIEARARRGARPLEAAPARRRRASTSRCPAAGRRSATSIPLTLVRDQVEAIFSRMGYEILEGPGDRGRLPQLRGAEHAARAPGARHAGHVLPRPRGPAGRPRHARHARQHAAAAARPARDAAAHAHLGDADPLHGGARAAGPDRRHRQGVPPRQPRPHAHADVPPVRGAARGRAA